MIYLCNTLITETKPHIGKGYVNRENLRSFNNFDIFKYSLASISHAYPWSKVILKIELDDCYLTRKDELHEFIKKEFNHVALHLSWKRNVYQHDWIETYDLLDDRLIWFYCNHDHIFIDSNSDYLLEIIQNMENEEEYCSLGFSHWPECIRTAQNGGVTYPVDKSTYQLNDTYASVRNNCIDSIQVITKELYKNWWLTGNFNQYKFPRPDYFGLSLNEIKSVPIHKYIIPLKELCRHFDGYQHCNPPILNNKCPALEIPPGFFDNNINIAYGFNVRKSKEYVNLNPTIKDYFATNVEGIDYKWTLDDIPTFWRPRISSTDISLDLIHDKETMIQYRLLDVLNTIYYDGFIINKELETAILNKYLKNYKEYIID